MDKYLLETFIMFLVSMSEPAIHSIKIENECCLLVITNIAPCTSQDVKEKKLVSTGDLLRDPCTISTTFS